MTPKIIADDFITREVFSDPSFNEMTSDEYDDYLAYCEAVMKGNEPFYLPDEVAPFEIAPCK